MNAVRH